MRLLMMLLSVGLLSACQTASNYSGEGTLTLSQSAASAAEKYFKNSNSKAMAVSMGGSYWRTSTCNHTKCLYDGGRAADKAVYNRCLKSGRSCGVFAVDHDIVWRGQISLPPGPNGEYILRVIEQVDVNRTLTRTGTAQQIDGTEDFALSIYMKGSQCSGKTNAQEKTWRLDCGPSLESSGTIGSASESLIWGQSINKKITVSIQEGGWPVLRKKLAERQLEVPASRPTTNVSNRGQIIPSDYNASLDWPGQDGQVFGKITRLGVSSRGSLSFNSKDQKLKCKGTLEVLYGTTGSWNLACENGQRADGTLRVDGDFVEGKGKTRDGTSVTFLSLR